MSREYRLDASGIELTAMHKTILSSKGAKQEGNVYVLCTPPYGIPHWRKHTTIIEDEEEVIEPTKPQPHGLGDTVEGWIKAAKLDKLAELYEHLSGKPCGCEKRKALLNRLWSYRKQ